MKKLLVMAVIMLCSGSIKSGDFIVPVFELEQDFAFFRNQLQIIHQYIQQNPRDGDYLRFVVNGLPNIIAEAQGIVDFCSVQLQNLDALQDMDIEME